MRYFLTLSFICPALLVSAVGAAPTAHARALGVVECSSQTEGQVCYLGGDDAGVCKSNTCQPIPVAGGKFYDAFGNEYATQSAASAADAKSSAASTAAASSIASTPGTSGTGIPTNPGDSTGGFPTVIQWIMSLFAWLVGVAALTLDTAVLYTVVGMGNYVKNLSAIGVAWTVLRDIGNIALIFGFLAVGITVILNVDFYGGGKKLLPTLIIAAVALNFSLFVSEAVIDVGNLFATQIYTQINGGQQAGVKGFDPGFSIRTANEGISNAIMAQLGLQGIYDDARRNHELYKSGNSWVIGFMGILLFLVVAFVMFSLALILIARFVILIFLIILSPVGVAGLAIPKLQNSAKLWWSTLLEQTITAPILLLLLYVALRVILDPLFLKGFGANNNGAWTSFFGGGSVANYGSMLLSFLVAMGLLLFVVMASKKLSAFGAKWATNTAGGLSFGATAFVGRRTAGRFSNYAAKRIRSSAWGHSETGRLLAGFADRGAKATFDVRGAQAWKTTDKAMTLEAGEPKKGGYKGREDELVKARTEYAKSLKKSDEDKKKEDEHKKNVAELGKQEEALIEQQKEKLEMSREEVKAKRQALEDARKSGNSNEVAEREEELKLAKDNHTALVSSNRSALQPIRDQIDRAKKDLKAASASPQLRYARALESKQFFPGAPRLPYDWTTTVGSARKEASGKIRGEANKDKEDEILDRLKSIEDKSSTPPTPPTPPAGGAKT